MSKKFPDLGKEIEFKEKVGSGLYGTVYAVEHEKYGNCALKILNPEVVDIKFLQDTRKKIHDESDVPSWLLNILEEDLSSDEPYIISSLQAEQKKTLSDSSGLGQRQDQISWKSWSLENYLLEEKSGRMRPSDWRCLMERLIGVLREWHSDDFVHGNLHHRNVFLPSGIDLEKATLVDASLVLQDGGFVKFDTALLFKPPESWGSEVSQPGKRHDVYSLGVLAFFAATGAFPYAADLAEEINLLRDGCDTDGSPLREKARGRETDEMRLAEGEALPVKTVGDLIRKRVDTSRLKWPKESFLVQGEREIINKCLEKNPQERPTSVAAVAKLFADLESRKRSDEEEKKNKQFEQEVKRVNELRKAARKSRVLFKYAAYSLCATGAVAIGFAVWAFFLRSDSQSESARNSTLTEENRTLEKKLNNLENQVSQAKRDLVTKDDEIRKKDDEIRKISGKLSFAELDAREKETTIIELKALAEERGHANKILEGKLERTTKLLNDRDKEIGELKKNGPSSEQVETEPSAETREDILEEAEELRDRLNRDATAEEWKSLVELLLKALATPDKDGDTKVSYSFLKDLVHTSLSATYLSRSEGNFEAASATSDGTLEAIKSINAVSDKYKNWVVMLRSRLATDSLLTYWAARFRDGAGVTNEGRIERPGQGNSEPSYPLDPVYEQELLEYFGKEKEEGPFPWGRDLSIESRLAVVRANVYEALRVQNSDFSENYRKVNEFNRTRSQDLKSTIRAQLSLLELIRSDVQKLPADSKKRLLKEEITAVSASIMNMVKYHADVSLDGDLKAAFEKLATVDSEFVGSNGPSAEPEFGDTYYGVLENRWETAKVRVKLSSIQARVAASGGSFFEDGDAIIAELDGIISQLKVSEGSSYRRSTPYMLAAIDVLIWRGLARFDNRRDAERGSPLGQRAKAAARKAWENWPEIESRLPGPDFRKDSIRTLLGKLNIQP